MPLEISKEITIEMAHRLPNHSGKCKNLHGHSWVIKAAVDGPLQESCGSPTEGMVLDYTDLKKPLETISRFYDHSVTLSYDDPLVPLLMEVDNKQALERLLHPTNLGYPLKRFYSRFGIINTLPGPPTSECLAIHWAEVVQNALHDIDSGVKLKYLSVKETCTSEAIWTPDNITI